MNRTKLKRVGSAIIAASVLGALLAPVATAAPPKWNMTATAQTPGVIVNGGAQAWNLHITNDGSSNISSLYLVDTTPDSIAYIWDSRHLCNTSGQLYCNFGALGPKDLPIDVTVAYQMPATGSSWTNSFELNSTGYVIGGNNSHGDAFDVPVSVSLEATQSDDNAGKWTLVNGDTLANSQTITRNNPQATRLEGLDAFAPTTIADGSAVSFTCDASVCTKKQFGQWSSVSVANGLPQGAPFLITITVYSKSVNGINDTSKVVVYHVTGTGTAVIGDVAGERCATAPTSITGDGCLNVSFDGAGNMILKVWVLQNGGFKGAAG